MRYFFSQDFTLKARELAKELGFNHIELDRISCIVSRGSKTRRTIARIHSLGKALQEGMQSQPCYVIELISEKFNSLPEEEKIKVLIHELMHIPHSFGGGFRHHKPYVTKIAVEEVYRNYVNNKNNKISLV